MATRQELLRLSKKELVLKCKKRNISIRSNAAKANIIESVLKKQQTAIESSTKINPNKRSKAMSKSTEMDGIIPHYKEMNSETYIQYSTTKILLQDLLSSFYRGIANLYKYNEVYVYDSATKQWRILQTMPINPEIIGHTQLFKSNVNGLIHLFRGECDSNYDDDAFHGEQKVSMYVAHHVWDMNRNLWQSADKQC